MIIHIYNLKIKKYNNSRRNIMSKNIDNSNEIFKHRFKNGEGDERILLISEKDQKAYLPYASWSSHS